MSAISRCLDETLRELISGNIRKYYEKTERLQLLETLFEAGKHSELAMAAHDLLAEDNLSDSELVECLVYGFLGYANVGIYQDSKELLTEATSLVDGLPRFDSYQAFPWRKEHMQNALALMQVRGSDAQLAAAHIVVHGKGPDNCKGSAVTGEALLANKRKQRSLSVPGSSEDHQMRRKVSRLSLRSPGIAQQRL